MEEEKFPRGYPQELENEDEGDEDQVETWDDWMSEDGESQLDFLCLFCGTRFHSADGVFEHCTAEHSFNFRQIVKDSDLDFYGSFKLINYVRRQVAKNTCWSCGLAFQSNSDLQNHLHSVPNLEKDVKHLWEDDLYLNPFMEDDSLLHSFDGDEEEEDDPSSMDREEIIEELMGIENLELRNDMQSILNGGNASRPDNVAENENLEDNVENMSNQFQNSSTNGLALQIPHQKQKNMDIKMSLANVSARAISDVNKSYFGSYGSFSIHREMLSDKARMDAYRGALLNNPSLMGQATVLDVGCGTGILSLFAAQAGATEVIAVEASDKMAAVATQIVRDNGMLSENKHKHEKKQYPGVIKVVNCMVEDLDKCIEILPNSVDVVVSEWMGYCLLYESMLSSVLYARDRWLKPGGAILPDTATIFGAGFGRGGTCIPFWENVYDFNMSYIGNKVMDGAASAPIIDTIDSQDLVTESAIVNSFDLATMKPDEMDFTASFELKLRTDYSQTSVSETCFCYGIVLWFETGFTSRFCKEMPTVLSTSPHSLKTHWYQTILTFREPVAMTTFEKAAHSVADVGTKENPAVTLKPRISIVRSSVHRSIDVSMEICGISLDGRKRSWPAQLFSL